MALNQESDREPASSTNLRSRVISNATVSIITYAVYLPVALFISRYTVHRVGLAVYGIWAALSSIIAFSGLLNLGVTAPVVKYTAEYVALRRSDHINRLLSTAALFFFVVALLFAAIMLLLSHWVMIRLFHQSGQNAILLRAYVTILVGFIIILTSSVLQSFLFGVQRADINAGITLGINLMAAAGTVLVLHMGLGLSGLVLNWFVTAVLNVAVLWLTAKKLLPSLRLNPFLFSRDEFKRIFAFSSRVQVASISLFLNDQVDRILVAYALGPVPLGYYQLAQRASQTISGASYAVMSGGLAAASDLAAAGNWDRLRELYIRSSRYLAIIDFGSCFAVGALAYPMVALWLGPGYGRVATTAIIILAGYAVFLPHQATTTCLNGIGRPEIRMRADLAFLCFHIPLSAALLWRFGFFGTVVGTAVAMSTTRIYVYWAGSRALGVAPLALVRKSFLQPFTGAVLAAVAALAVSSLTHRPLIGLVLGLGVFSVVFVAYVLLFALDRYDRDLVRSYARRFAPARHRDGGHRLIAQTDPPPAAHEPSSLPAEASLRRCPHCGSRNVQRRRLPRHLRPLRSIGIAVRAYTCLRCGKNFLGRALSI